VAKRRSYGQFCSMARALDVVSERWTLLIVRNLMLGPRRYSDLMTELPGITTNLLAERLRAMESSGLIAKRPAIRRATT
jgi:DNA-binding HxlR family transcriptional regulator